MTFENFDKLDAEAGTKMECGICWHVYDPGLGDEVWQVPPGTEFSDLPEHWRCPNCDALPAKFMRLGDGDRD